MNDSTKPLPPIKLSAPRFYDQGPLLISGLRVPLREDAAEAVPRVWQKFLHYFGQLPQQVDRKGYGLCIHNKADVWAFDYLAGCAVWDNTDVPAELSTFVIPAQQYAIFDHHGHVSQLRATLDFIFSQWLPTSGYQQTSSDKDFLHFLEFYGENFDNAAGLGDMAIWLPIAKK